MGAKKKARSRQKQAVRDALSDHSSSNSSDGENAKAPHLFQAGDNLERFLVHIHTCKKNDSKRLGKFMPRLTRDLERGKFATEEIVQDLMSEYDHKFNMGSMERIAIMGKLRSATRNA
ncbi:expressed unknown protein [Seminavis robusta]|uniref:Uncharacterized protein n=1 Tax=Seminavis robusta TaxID=568900 RepID=A0A9N8HM92_9STRA|nr:expressed unknown protein [Seminavis robusta]|eukprot:Sro1096_g240760.1 n/a (118) ;mRNA; r:13551-13904